MSDRQLPYPLPGKWNPAGPFRNPGGTNPLPAPSNLPVTVWFGGRVPVAWTVNQAPEILFSYTWSSPTFDLYPSLRGVSPDAENSRIAGATPIWGGPGSLLRIQISSPLANGLGAIDLTGFRLTYREFGHISQVTQVQSIDAEQDVTAQFTSNQQASVLLIEPKPIRYYRVECTFSVLNQFGYPDATGPAMSVQGAMY